jgi:NADH-quinone oxidoreductase subunit H
MKLGWRMLLPASLINILATGLVVLLVQGSGEAVQQGLTKVAELTQALLALSGLVAGTAFVLFILRPVEHKRVLSSTSAQFAAEGTRRYPMGA